MSQRRSGKELGYCSNARFLYQWQRYLLVECIETFSPEILMASTPDITYNILFLEYYLQRTSLLTISQREIRSFLPYFDCFPTVNIPEITVWFLCLRFQLQGIERLIDLTDSFTWEDLPTRDADTGHLTAAGWIPLTLKYNRNAAIAIISFHTVQSTIRIVTNHETVFTAWYPFDWTVSPFYELVNISQVKISIKELSSIAS